MSRLNKSNILLFMLSVCLLHYGFGQWPPKPSKPPETPEVQETAEVFSEEQRKKIFLEAIEADKRGMAEADRQYPNDLGLNIALKQQLATKYRRDVLKKYGLTEDSEEWRLIAEEGVKKDWLR